MKVVIETRNFETVAKRLIDIGPQGQKALTKTLVKGGHLVETAAKEKCPVRTGRLRSSITTEKVKPFEVHVGTNVFYGPFVEYGTRKMSAQPYLRPSLFEKQSTIKKMLLEALREVLPT